MHACKVMQALSDKAHLVQQHHWWQHQLLELTPLLSFSFSCPSSCLLSRLHPSPCHPPCLTRQWLPAVTHRLLYMMCKCHNGRHRRLVMAQQVVWQTVLAITSQPTTLLYVFTYTNTCLDLQTQNHISYDLSLQSQTLCHMLAPTYCACYTDSMSSCRHMAQTSLQKATVGAQHFSEHLCCCTFLHAQEHRNISVCMADRPYCPLEQTLCHQKHMCVCVCVCLCNISHCTYS